MKKLLIVLSAFALGMTACTSQPATDSQNGETAPRKTGMKLKNVSDSISYAIGSDYGRYLKKAIETVGSDINPDVVMKAIKEAMANKSTLTPEEAFGYMQRYFMEIVPARNLEKGAKLLEEVAKQPNVQKTESGLLYEIITPGSDKRVMSDRDEVKVKYRGTLPLRGDKEFDGNYDKPDTARFAVNRVIKGWTEGLKLVGEGGKIRLWIPSELGYGRRGQGGMIQANEPLEFEIDLIEVIPAVPAEETEAAAPATK